MLDRAGFREEAHDLLDRALAGAFVVRVPWASRDSAGLLGEALVRVGRLEDGVAQLDGLSDEYGALGRAQVRIAGALAQAGALDKAETIALAADRWHRSDALERVAVAFAENGMTQRAERAATAIAEEGARALTSCRIVPLADPSAVRAATRQAAEARNPEALAVIAMRLALGGDFSGGRDLAHQALEIIRTLEEHEMVGPLGDLGRVLLKVGDAASVQLVDELLCQVHDPEYRPDGRLRLALALAEAGQGRRARAIVRQELPNVDQLQLKGFPLGRAVMLARIAFILSQAGVA